MHFHWIWRTMPKRDNKLADAITQQRLEWNGWPANMIGPLKNTPRNWRCESSKRNSRNLWFWSDTVWADWYAHNTNACIRQTFDLWLRFHHRFVARRFWIIHSSNGVVTIQSDTNKWRRDRIFWPCWIHECKCWTQKQKTKRTSLKHEDGNIWRLARHTIYKFRTSGRHFRMSSTLKSTDTGISRLSNANKFGVKCTILLSTFHK